MTSTSSANPASTSDAALPSSNTIPSSNSMPSTLAPTGTGSALPFSLLQNATTPPFQFTPTSGNPNSTSPTPTPNQGAPTSKAQQLLATYMLLSPDSKTHMTKAFNALKPANTDTSTPSSTMLFSTDKEIKMCTTLDSTYGLGIHPTINNLAKAGQYLSLILFTDDMTKCLHCGDDFLDAFTWQEAWKHYLTWLQDPKVAQPEIYECWLNHYSLLSKDEAICSNFKAIIIFDMNWHTSYTAQPFIHDPVEWQLHLQATKNEIATEHFLQLSSRDEHSNTSHRYNPYDSSRKNVRCPRDHHDQSFWDNTSDIKSKSDLTCLICGHNSHRITECKEEITTKDKPTFAKFINGQLARCSNDAPICTLFNLIIARKLCKHSHAPSQHLCFLCGENTHAALACLCI
ncbi:hypothetical protein V8E55_001052 [Tylopilus felleus]